MFKKLLIGTASIMVAMSAFAVDMSKVDKAIELKDGSTVYVFKDGKMGMEDKKGRTVRMKPGHAMETKDGQRIIMVGDEVARLESLKREEYRGGQ